MKIVTWNVNGLRSLIKEFGGIDNVFRVLDADIVCFQESRIGPDDISIGMIPDGYDAFLSSCTFNKGYAGVITYTHLPILPKVAFTTLKDFLYSEYISNEKQIFDTYESSFIDKANDEGRLVILVFDNAILMNIYFPANNEEERADFRKDFYYLIKDMLLQIDRSVYSLFIVGDFNTACGIIDSAFLEDDHDKNGFVEQFRSMSEWLELIQLPLKEKGCSLIDTYRILHPDQRNAYTCFCNILGGRETNFGTRIDYIFCDQSLEKSLQSSAILSTIKGSDHLPVRTEIQFEFHSKTTCVGLRQMVKSQAKIDHFFTKQIIEKEAKCSVKRKSEWTCRRCTLINPITQMTCEACGFKQPQDSKEQLVDIGIDSLFGKRRKQVRVPLCSGHHLPCVRHQVVKEGKNKGKFFYISFYSFFLDRFLIIQTCSLPKGFSNDPKARCNFFVWEDSIV